MADVTLEEVLQLAEQLTPEEQKALIARLTDEVRQREAARMTSTDEEFTRTFGLLVFDVGPWPTGLTLRREDEYGDEGR